MPHELLDRSDRILVHVSTDKPLYKPGDTMYGRAVLLDAFTHAPPERPVSVTFEVRSPKGDAVHSAAGIAERGVAPFAYEIPKNQTGGEYTLVATFFGDQHPPGERTFSIRGFRVPRLSSDLEFVNKAYGAGDTVVATLEVTRAEGGVPAGAAVTAVATVDGQEVHRGELTLSDEGRCEVSFALPKTIEHGEGTLVMVIRDGGVQESAAKTIPIAIDAIALSFYPEGGDLVAGLRSRLYFEARSRKGKPADVAGRIVDARGASLGTFRTEHEGRGWAEIEPVKSGDVYMAVLDEPAGIDDIYPIPTVAKDGFCLRSSADAGATGSPVRLEVSSTHAGTAVVCLYHRDKEVASVDAELAANTPAEVVLTPPRSAEGTLRATVYDDAGKPRAERLIFQRPTRRVEVEVQARPERASLRDPIKVEVTTRDAKGKPVPATVELAVVDRAVLETIDKRERAPRLPVQVLLESEVSELYDAHVYLEDGDEAARKRDLLLATQGWRRFAFYDIDAFLAEHGDDAERVLATHRPPPAPAGVAWRGAGANMMMFGGPPPAPGAMPMAPPMAAPMMVAQAAPIDVADGFADFAVEPEAALDDALGAEIGGGLDMDEPPAMEMAAAVPAQMLAPAPLAEIVAEPLPPAAPPAPPPPPGLLDRIGQALGLARKQQAFAPPPAPPMPVLAVREYAHSAPRSTEGGRTDFAQTLYWNAGIDTGADGRAEVSFALCDSVTSFAVRVDAFTAAGELGAGDATIESRRPFYVEPKLPLEVTAGDRCETPVAVINGTRAKLEARLSVSAEGPIAVTEETRSLSLGPDQRGRVLVPFDAEDGQGEARLRVAAEAGKHSDEVTRGLQVVPTGFPFQLAFGGKLEKTVQHSFTLPDSVVPGSLEIEAQIYPSPLASLQQAVTALLREPCGCFEQASSSTYPNIMVMQYLSSHSGVDPAAVKRAGDLLSRGYDKLISYECKDKGYEWFGGDPGHEALTAYGLMEFTDMAEVYPVDRAMIERTRNWLLSRRDGKGGFSRNPRALDSFGGAPKDITDAYITWALSQARIPGLDAEIAHIREQARTSEDPYFLALAANVLLDAEDDASSAVLDRLAKKQAEDGSIPGAATSITRSGGDSLTIETTSLAILALLRSPTHAGVTETAMRWLLERCKGGRFGATQSTILALKAIVTYDAARATARKAGKLWLRVAGEDRGGASFKAEHQDPIAVVSRADALAAGSHAVELEMEDGAPMPYSITVRYHAAIGASAPGCKLSLHTKLARAEVEEGLAVDLSVELGNRTDEGLPMTVAVIGLPGGLEPRVDQLDELTDEGTIDFYELKNREIILYRRQMAPRETSAFTLSLLAAIPGQYTGPASRAYLYYTDEDKVWTDPLQVTIGASGR